LVPAVVLVITQLPIPLELIAPVHDCEPSDTITFPVIAVGEFVVFVGAALKFTV